jgi:hypothetical protein
MALSLLSSSVVLLCNDIIYVVSRSPRFTTFNFRILFYALNAKMLAQIEYMEMEVSNTLYFILFYFFLIEAINRTTHRN